MSMVWRDETLGATDKIVMLSLADHADDEGFCYPSIARLEKRTGLKRRTVQDALKRLRSRGYVTVYANKGRGGANLYKVSPGGAADAPVREMHPCGKRTGGVRLTASRGAADAPKPSRTIKEPSPLTPQGGRERKSRFGVSEEVLRKAGLK